jgi:hypothetical protein
MIYIIYIISETSVSIMKWRGSRGRDHMVVGFHLPLQSVPTTTNVVSSNPVHGEVYSLPHYVIKFVNDLR